MRGVSLFHRDSQKKLKWRRRDGMGKLSINSLLILFLIPKSFSMALA